jgi:hypothetical protein
MTADMHAALRKDAFDRVPMQAGATEAWPLGRQRTMAERLAEAEVLFRWLLTGELPSAPGEVGEHGAE